MFNCRSDVKTSTLHRDVMRITDQIGLDQQVDQLRTYVYAVCSIVVASFVVIAWS